MNKKAELSLSIIVMAVVALLILIVLSYITLNGAGNFTEGVNSCNAGERCVEDKNECDIPNDYDTYIPKSCKTSSGVKGSYCCKRI